MNRFLIIIFLAFPVTAYAVDVQLKEGVEFHKYGVVTVLNPDKSFNRQFKLTKQEMADFHSGGSNVPKGVTREEWESGNTVVAGKGMEVGDAVVNNGSLTIKYAEEVVNGRFQEYFITLKAGEWSGSVINATADTASLDAIKDSRGNLLSEKKPLELKNGVLTY